MTEVEQAPLTELERAEAVLSDARRLRGEIVAKAGLAKGRLERVRRSKSKYALSAATGDEAAKGSLAQANVTLRKVELDLEDLEEASEQAAERVQLAERELARLNDLARADRIEVLAGEVARAAGAVDEAAAAFGRGVRAPGRGVPPALGRASAVDAVHRSASAQPRRGDDGRARGWLGAAAAAGPLVWPASRAVERRHTRSTRSRRWSGSCAARVRVVRRRRREWP